MKLKQATEREFMDHPIESGSGYKPGPILIIYLELNYLSIDD